MKHKYKELEETKKFLFSTINKKIEEENLTQVAAGRILGVSQSYVSQLKKGVYQNFSMERLIHFLNRLGKDVTLVIRGD